MTSPWIFDKNFTIRHPEEARRALARLVAETKDAGEEEVAEEMEGFISHIFERVGVDHADKSRPDPYLRVFLPIMEVISPFCKGGVVYAETEQGIAGIHVGSDKGVQPVAFLGGAFINRCTIVDLDFEFTRPQGVIDALDAFIEQIEGDDQDAREFARVITCLVYGEHVFAADAVYRADSIDRTIVPMMKAIRPFCASGKVSFLLTEQRWKETLYFEASSNEVIKRCEMDQPVWELVSEESLGS